MSMSASEKLKTFQNSNQDILDYFNDLYVSKLELIQNLKTEQFELKAKIDELVKTLDIYSFKNSAGQNVFSPFSSTATSQQEKASQIELKLKDLNEVKTSLDYRIDSLQKEIEQLKSRISSLSDANKNINDILDELTEEFPDESIEPEPEEETTDDAPVINHGINILRLTKYNNDKIADEISGSVKELLEGNKHKLEVLSWLLKTDVNRAKVTLDELIDSTNHISDSLDNIISELANEIDTDEPLWTLLDDTILEYKENHPECVIESDIDCPEYDLNIPEIVIINLIYILREILDNAFKHSNANRIVVKIHISNRIVDVYINDNGIGIDSNYHYNTPWYSGLHMVQEIIYLLDGEFKIDGDIISGTNVRFSFPVEDDSFE